MSGPEEVVVVTGRATDRADVVALALHEAGLPGAGVSLSHACPRCGSDRHGRPHLVGSPAGVSLSRAGDLLVVALVREGHVGVDVARVDAFGFAGFDDVALPPGAPATRGDLERARLWVRTEALLKLRGTGLTDDPRWVRPGGDEQTVEPALGDGLAGCVAVAADRAPRVRLRAAAGAPRRAATTGTAAPPRRRPAAPRSP